MKDKSIYVANDNGLSRAGYKVGVRTYCSLRVIESILRDVKRGHVHFPERFIKNLESDLADLKSLEAEEG